MPKIIICRSASLHTFDIKAKPRNQSIVLPPCGRFFCFFFFGGVNEAAAGAPQRR
jgi:hypothetical protein